MRGMLALLSVATSGSPARAQTIPLEVQSPNGTSFVVEVFPRDAREALPVASCSTPCTLSLRPGFPYEMKVHGTTLYTPRRARTPTLEEPLLAKIDPGRRDAYYTAFGVALGATTGFGVSGVLLYVEAATRADETGHDTRLTAFAVSTVAHAFAAFIAWPIALNNRTRIEVSRRVPSVALTPRSVALGWVF